MLILHETRYLDITDFTKISETSVCLCVWFTYTKKKIYLIVLKTVTYMNVLLVVKFY